jgi:hypothetical protein
MSPILALVGIIFLIVLFAKIGEVNRQVAKETGTDPKSVTLRSAKFDPGGSS